MKVQFVDNPLNPGVMQSLTAVLRLLATQEGCDGAPYDQMQVAADYIDELTNKLIEFEELIDEAKELVSKQPLDRGQDLGLSDCRWNAYNLLNKFIALEDS